MQVIWLIAMMVGMVACTNYKPQGGFRKGSPTSNGVAGPAVAKGTSLVLDHKKLMDSPGSYSVKISYAGGTQNVSITPSGTETKIPLEGLPAGSTQVMVLEIAQNEDKKFIAKKAGVTLQQNTSSTVVIDDCLVLPSPWDGKENEGSCEWSIQESN